jgi:hypothetical protein
MKCVMYGTMMAPLGIKHRFPKSQIALWMRIRVPSHCNTTLHKPTHIQHTTYTSSTSISIHTFISTSHSHSHSHSYPFSYHLTIHTSSILSSHSHFHSIHNSLLNILLFTYNIIQSPHYYAPRIIHLLLSFNFTHKSDILTSSIMTIIGWERKWEGEWEWKENISQITERYNFIIFIWLHTRYNIT